MHKALDTMIGLLFCFLNDVITRVKRHIIKLIKTYRILQTSLTRKMFLHYEPF